MSEGLKDFLNKFDGQYKAATTAAKVADTGTSYEDISDGKYIARIVGIGWRDYQNENRDGWSGMGPIMRLRIISGRNGEKSRFQGWKEDVTFFLINVHPERGILTPQLNEKKLAFFLGQMERIQAGAPSAISDLAEWTGAVGLDVFMSIVTKKDGDRTYRNVYLDGRAVHVASDEGNYPVEAYVDQRFTQNGPGNGLGVTPKLPAQDDEIPF